MAQTTDDLKKILVYVNLEKPDDATLKTLVSNVKEKSTGDYKDKVFFIANTGEIIVQGTTFGVSDEFKARVDALETKTGNLETTVEALTGLTGVPGEAAQVTISDDSVIGKYVAEKIAASSVKVELVENSGLVFNPEPTATDAGTTYTIGTDLSAWVDDAVHAPSIITKDGKLLTNVELKLVHESGAHGDASPFLVLQTIQGDDANKKPVEISKFDVSEFVADGMIDSVKWENGDPNSGVIIITWNADGEAAGKQTTRIELTNLFQIEAIHTTTPDYILVDKETPGKDQDTDKKLAYHIDAKVNGTVLTDFTKVTHTDATDTVDEKYTPSYSSDSEIIVALSNLGTGLVDIQKLGAKLIQVDKDIAKVGNEAIDRTKAANEDIENQIKALQEALNQEVTDRGDADDNLQEQITANKDAIDVLNSDEDTTGSVANSIKLFKETLKNDQTYDDENGLVTVKVELEDGLIKAQTDHNVKVKTDSLISSVQEAQYADFTVTTKDGTTMYTTRNLNEVAAHDPALVTTQDAWVYGQCIKSQAINAINSDDNEYIKIARVANAAGDRMITKVVFTPWGEVHSLDELATLK